MRRIGGIWNLSQNDHFYRYFIYIKDIKETRNCYYNHFKFKIRNILIHCISYYYYNNFILLYFLNMLKIAVSWYDDGISDGMCVHRR